MPGSCLDIGLECWPLGNAPRNPDGLFLTSPLDGTLPGRQYLESVRDALLIILFLVPKRGYDIDEIDDGPLVKHMTLSQLESPSYIPSFFQTPRVSGIFSDQRSCTGVSLFKR